MQLLDIYKPVLLNRLFAFKIMSKKFCVENNNYTMFSFYLQLFVASIIFQERIERKAKE